MYGAPYNRTVKTDRCSIMPALPTRVPDQKVQIAFRKFFSKQSHTRRLLLFSSGVFAHQTVCVCLRGNVLPVWPKKGAFGMVFAAALITERSRKKFPGEYKYQYRRGNPLRIIILHGLLRPILARYVFLMTCPPVSTKICLLHSRVTGFLLLKTWWCGLLGWHKLLSMYIEVPIRQILKVFQEGLQGRFMQVEIYSGW